jgi:hypothetical protein
MIVVNFWREWLKTENLALVGGNPYYLPCHLILFTFIVFIRISIYYSSLGERSSTVHSTCIAPSVLYF